MNNNDNFHPEFYSTAASSTGIDHTDVTSIQHQQILQNSQGTQPILQHHQTLRTSEFFHFAPQDNNFYFVTCKIITHEDSDSMDDYDHAFFYQQYPNLFEYHVTCKLFTCLSIEDVLNETICGNLDVNYMGHLNHSKRKGLSLYQKSSLERDLKNKLFHLMQRQIPASRRSPECNIINTSPFHRDISDHMMTGPIVSEYHNNNLPSSDRVNGLEVYTGYTYNDHNNFLHYQNFH